MKALSALGTLALMAAGTTAIVWLLLVEWGVI